MSPERAAALLDDVASDDPEFSVGFMYSSTGYETTRRLLEARVLGYDVCQREPEQPWKDVAHIAVNYLVAPVLVPHNLRGLLAMGYMPPERPWLE